MLAERGVRRAARAGRWVLRLLALALLVSVLRAALHDFCQAWDSPYYHLPFAARFGGVLGPDDYVFSPDNEARFAGFPLLGERIQGLLYRLSGRPEAANLLAFASVPALALYLRARFRVPASVAVLGLFALPLVLTHATSTYVDLPANAAAAVFLLEAFALLRAPRAATAARVALALVPATIAAQMRFQLLPTVGLGLVLLGLACLRRQRGGGRARAIVALLLGVPCVIGKLLANVARFGNPVYPVELRVLGRALPFHETRYESYPEDLAHTPQPVRFLYSLVERGLPPLGAPSRWTVDQFAAGTPAHRMGGSFGPYVVALLVALAALALGRRGRPRELVVLLLALTAVVAAAPQSHELRYYLVWPMLLVASVLIGVSSLPRRALAPRGLVTALVGIAFAVVAGTTRGEWLVPSGSRLEELVAKRVSPEVLGRIGEGETVCLWKPPWTLLYAGKYHGRRYRVVEGESGCGVVRRVE
ncbi:MAG: hypothetical protein IPQ09_17495 [Myxococcales bacterium]|nr:hypothetical protein [Myxococcales bacterium]